MALYSISHKGSVQLLRCEMVHGVDMCFTRAHIRAPPLRLATHRTVTGNQVEGRFRRMSRRLGDSDIQG